MSTTSVLFASDGSTRSSSPRLVMDVGRNQHRSLSQLKHRAKPSGSAYQAHSSSININQQDSDSATDSDSEPVPDRVSLAASLGTSPAWAKLVQ